MVMFVANCIYLQFRYLNITLMKEANLKIISDLKIFLSNVEQDNNFKRLFCQPKTFIRKRILPISSVILFLINMPKKTLSVELNDYFKIIEGDKKCTKSAFSQQRSKLNYSLFYAWNKTQTDSFYKHYKDNVATWKGFKLIAVDGSTFYLFDKPEVKEYFGTQSNQHVDIPMARLMLAHDVLNDIITRSCIYPIRLSEHHVIPNWILQMQQDELGLYDRGFMSFKNVWLHTFYHKEFVIRSKVGFNNEIKEFVASKKRCKIVELSITNNAIAELKKNGHSLTKGEKVKVRLIRIKLSSGAIEVLVTNLFDTKKYPYKCFKDLYFQRWKVETSIGVKKNLMQLEIVSGLTVNAVKQDFYASVFVYNLLSILMKGGEEELVKKTKNRKHKYKINRNNAIGSFKNEIVKIFLFLNPDLIIKKLIDVFVENLEPVRPDRKFERKTKNMRLKGKYQTLTNYKRCI